MKILITEKDKSNKNFKVKAIDENGNVTFIDPVFSKFPTKTHYGRIYLEENDLSKE